MAAQSSPRRGARCPAPLPRSTPTESEPTTSRQPTLANAEGREPRVSDGCFGDQFARERSLRVQRESRPRAARRRGGGGARVAAPVSARSAHVPLMPWRARCRRSSVPCRPPQAPWRGASEHAGGGGGHAPYSPPCSPLYKKYGVAYARRSQRRRLSPPEYCTLYSTERA